MTEGGTLDTGGEAGSLMELELDVSDAEQIEELAEIALAYLQDLGGERVLVVHGDEDHANPVTQTFEGLTYENIESLLWEWAPVAEKSTEVQLFERFGRKILLAPLRDSSGDCLGLLYLDTQGDVVGGAEESLQRFSAHYLKLLLDICVLRSGTWDASPPSMEIHDSDSWEDAYEEAYQESRSEEVSEEDDQDQEEVSVERLPEGALPDLQDYLLLDWYR